MNRYAAFAQRVAARHRRDPVSARTLAMLLLRLPAGAGGAWLVHQRFVQYSRPGDVVNLRLWVTLHPPAASATLAPSPRTLRPAVALGTSPGPAVRVVTEGPGHGVKGPWSRWRHEICTVAAPRREPVAARAPARPGGAISSTRPSAAPRRVTAAVPRVPVGVRRSVPPALAPAEPPPRAEVPGWGPAPTSPFAMQAPTAAGAHAAVDVERLTDRVVDMIDRRLLAHRERLGKGRP